MKKHEPTGTGFYTPMDIAPGEYLSTEATDTNELQEEFSLKITSAIAFGRQEGLTAGEVTNKILKLIQAHNQTLLASIRAELPEKRDQYYGMVCRDFSHCIPAYMDIESVEWWNEAIDSVFSILTKYEGGGKS